jgi:hypothetical protein
MLVKKVGFIVVLFIVFSLSMAAAAQAAPPVPGDEEVAPEGASLGETLSFNNLGTIMSGKNSTTGDSLDETDDDVDEGTNGDPDDDTGDTDDTDGEADNDQDATKQHPVARALAEYFFDKMPVDMVYEDVNALYDEIMTLHEAGNGFGNITKAYFFADKLDMKPAELLDTAHGMGWGNVLKNGDIHPGSVGNGDTNSNRPDHAGRPEKDGPPGQMKKDDTLDGESTSPSDLVGQGGDHSNNSRNYGNQGNNGNGNDRGVNGQPDDKDKGNNGHGNEGNDGRGNGNGKKK